MKPSKLQLEMSYNRITLAIATARLAAYVDRAEGKPPNLGAEMLETSKWLRSNVILGLPAIR